MREQRNGCPLISCNLDNAVTEGLCVSVVSFPEANIAQTGLTQDAENMLDNRPRYEPLKVAYSANIRLHGLIPARQQVHENGCYWMCACTLCLSHHENSNKTRWCLVFLLLATCATCMPILLNLYECTLPGNAGMTAAVCGSWTKLSYMFWILGNITSCIPSTWQRKPCRSLFYYSRWVILGLLKG